MMTDSKYTFFFHKSHETKGVTWLLEILRNRKIDKNSADIIDLSPTGIIVNRNISDPNWDGWALGVSCIRPGYIDCRPDSICLGDIPDKDLLIIAPTYDQLNATVFDVNNFEIDNCNNTHCTNPNIKVQMKRNFKGLCVRYLKEYPKSIIENLSHQCVGKVEYWTPQKCQKMKLLYNRLCINEHPLW